jgi:hypothetical protein
LSYPALGIGGVSGNTPQAQSQAQSVPHGVINTSGGAVWGPLTGTNAAGDPSSTGDYIGSGVGTAGAVYTGVQGVEQIAKGGGQNIAGGISKVATAAAELDPEPISKGILAGVALVSGLVSSMMGDPRANRQKALTEEEIANTYTAPTPLNVVTNANGMLTTTDAHGRVESLDALPSVSSYNRLLGFNPYDMSHVISSAGWQLNPSGLIPPSQVSAPASAPVIHYSPQISTMDSKSFMDHGPDFANALIPVLQGTHRIGTEIQRVVNGG